MTADTAQHTETPWIAKRMKTGDVFIKIIAPHPMLPIGEVYDIDAFGSVGVSDANALFIVRACNSHEGLVKACKAIICEGDHGNTVYGDPDHISLNDAIWMCQHEVDKAEGRELTPRPEGGWTEDDRPRTEREQP